MERYKNRVKFACDLNKSDQYKNVELQNIKRDLMKKNLSDFDKYLMQKRIAQIKKECNYDDSFDVITSRNKSRNEKETKRRRKSLEQSHNKNKFDKQLLKPVDLKLNKRPTVILENVLYDPKYEKYLKDLRNDMPPSSNKFLESKSTSKSLENINKVSWFDLEKKDVPERRQSIDSQLQIDKKAAKEITKKRRNSITPEILIQIFKDKKKNEAIRKQNSGNNDFSDSNSTLSTDFFERVRRSNFEGDEKKCNNNEDSEVENRTSCNFNDVLDSVQKDYFVKNTSDTNKCDVVLEKSINVKCTPQPKPENKTKILESPKTIDTMDVTNKDINVTKKYRTIFKDNSPIRRECKSSIVLYRPIHTNLSIESKKNIGEDESLVQISQSISSNQSASTSKTTLDSLTTTTLSASPADEFRETIISRDLTKRENMDYDNEVSSTQDTNSIIFPIESNKPNTSSLSHVQHDQVDTSNMIEIRHAPRCYKRQERRKTINDNSNLLTSSSSKDSTIPKRRKTICDESYMTSDTTLMDNFIDIPSTTTLSDPPKRRGRPKGSTNKIKAHDKRFNQIVEIEKNSSFLHGFHLSPSTLNVSNPIPQMPPTTLSTSNPPHKYIDLKNQSPKSNKSTSSRESDEEPLIKLCKRVKDTDSSFSNRNNSPSSRSISKSPEELNVNVDISKTYSKSNYSILQKVFVPPDIEQIIEAEASVRAQPRATYQNKKKKKIVSDAFVDCLENSLVVQHEEQI